MIQACLAEVGFYGEPVAPCVVDDDELLLRSSDEERTVVLSVHEISHNNFNVGLNFGVAWSLGGRGEVMGFPEIFELIDEMLFLSSKHFT